MLRQLSWVRGSVALALVVPGFALLAEPSSSAEDTRLAAAYVKIPLSFEANAGQTDAQVAFLARGAGYTLFLTPAEAVLSLRAGSSDAAALPASLRLKLRGASRTPRVTGLEPLATRSNYLVGNDPARWRTDVPHFGKVRYEAVYPGIDLVYYGRQGQLEYDFVVRPGADPRQIRLDFVGADRVELDVQGDLLVRVGQETLRQHKPIVYQEREGQRQAVAGSYVVDGRSRAAFRLGDYDRSQPLVIDPVLTFSTYLGGGDDAGQGIAVDASGYAYVTGRSSYGFPLANPLQGTPAGLWDVFVAKLDTVGSSLVYSTYLGGSGYDEGLGIAVDTSGNAYVTGYTKSANFPTASPLQGANAGGSDVFVAKLNAAGSALVYSTYLGGSGDDTGRRIAVDSSGNAYLVGDTSSLNFPTAAPFQPLNQGGPFDAFVVKLNAAGTALVYSTYLGGGFNDVGRGLALDGSGAAYVTGETASLNFPTANAFQPTNAGGANGGYDAFVTQLNPSGSALVYSTYLGGSQDFYGLGEDHGRGIAVDSLGQAYVTGDTSSTNFPTANAIQPAYASYGDAFVTKLNAAGSALVYSTYLGGHGGYRINGEDVGNDIAVDRAGCAHVTGWTGAPDFPTVRPLDPVGTVTSKAFVAQLNAAGSAFKYSTYLGGGTFPFDNQELATGIAVDAARNTYVVGRTSSNYFPTVNPIQATFHGNGQFGYNAFVSRILDRPKGDFDGDGRTDLVFRNNFDGAENLVWFMDGVTRTAQARVTPYATSADWRIRGVDKFDFGDTNDLVFWNQVTGQVEFWLMNGTDRVGAPVPLSGGPVLPPNWDLSATADFNRDGWPDIVWRDFTTQKIAIWTMNGTAKLGDVVPTPDQAVDSNWAIVTAADYNDDGSTDFLWYNSTSGKIVTWYMDAAVARTAGQFTTPANAGDNNWKVLASADYSAAYVPGTPPYGSPDIVWRNETSGNQVVWHLDYNSTRLHGEFTSPAANYPALDWTIVGPR